ncbi:phosphotriesterase family protein [Spirosoma endbachense]|uniref:Aryldialkylphosphatase n=1 Tax=Spirosoma endbachense TaxID=2666025 RepID=A0A6P1W606_9BACT|nr:aryldialkylphosphatase [Spirosoma endbachense]QHW00345.1 aryldialkylphosphatase [Spirosoma endbachense]
MSFIRTVLGDISPAQAGTTYAHEHLIIEESFPTQANPDFLLNDIDKVSAELAQVYAAGGRTMVDTMPANCGRNVVKLAEVSRRTGIQIVVPTGIHLEMYYPRTHWRYQYSEDQLTRLFIADVEEGIDRYDYNGPVVERTPHKAGMIKLATGDDPVSAHQELIFRSVVNTHRETGVPILTHTNAGRHGLAQADLFAKLGADLSHVVLSHMDRCQDLTYHRELLKTGVRVEFDSAFRWKKGEENRTYQLLEALLPDFPEQITAGMDAARHTYWQSYGGSPGLTYLLTTFRDELAQRGLGDYWNRLMIDNPAALYSFRQPQ